MTRTITIGVWGCRARISRIGPNAADGIWVKTLTGSNAAAGLVFFVLPCRRWWRPRRYRR
jgi:hypothetical protein